MGQEEVEGESPTVTVLPGTTELPEMPPPPLEVRGFSEWFCCFPEIKKRLTWYIINEKVPDDTIMAKNNVNNIS